MNAIPLLFEFLNDCELVKRKRVNPNLIGSLSKPDIFQIVEILLHLAEGDRARVEHSTFTHSASQSLVGRSKCSYLLHRLQQADEVGRFAVMYSDRVYIENFFLDYEHFNQLGVSDLRKTLFDDVCMLVFMKPLLDAGFIQFFTPEMHSCPNCLGAFFGSFEGKVDRGYDRLVRDYYKNSTVSLIGYNKRLCKFELEGPEPFYDHSVIMTYPGTKGRIRELIVNKPGLLEDLRQKKKVQLSRTLTKELGLHRRFAGSVASSATFGILSAKILSASFLTDNSLDLKFLSGLSNSSQINTRNDISLKHLTSIVPFLPDVPVNNLIKLRKREQEAFINFRSALNKAIEEFKASKTPFTEKQARELYSDLISPRLAKLDLKVKSAKRDLVKKGVRSVGAVVGVIAFGLYSGLISAEFAELIKTLGLGKIAFDVLEKSIPIGEATSAAKADDLYFLWKAKRLSGE